MAHLLLDVQATYAAGDFNSKVQSGEWLMYILIFIKASSASYDTLETAFQNGKCLFFLFFQVLDSSHTASVRVRARTDNIAGTDMS